MITRQPFSTAMRFFVGVITTTIVVVVALWFTMVVFGKATATTIITDSMKPTFSSGSNVFVQQVDPNEIHKGDIISFNTQEQKYPIVHRVEHRNLNTSDTRPITTRGDANPVSDKPISVEQVNGKLVTVPGTNVPVVLPFVGWLRQNPLWVAVGFLVFGLLFFYSDEIGNKLDQRFAS